MKATYSEHKSDVLVSLPMYDWPEQQTSHDRFWSLLRTEMLRNGFTALPESLTRDASADVWQNPQTLITQTCGFPLVHTLKHTVQLLGTPCYDVPFFTNGLYASVVLVRDDSTATGILDFLQHRIAISSVHSQSGFNALRNLFISESAGASIRFSNQTLVTGSHRESVRAVVDGQADLCALDPVSWQLAKRYEPDTAQLRVLCQTGYSPALPLVCSTTIAEYHANNNGGDFTVLPDTIQHCWNQAIAANVVIRDSLMLAGITTLDRATYEAVPAGAIVWEGSAA